MSTTKIDPDALSKVTGGVDYAYHHPNGFRIALGQNLESALAYHAANPGGQLMQRGGDGVISPVKMPTGE